MIKVKKTPFKLSQIVLRNSTTLDNSQLSLKTLQRHQGVPKAYLIDVIRLKSRKVEVHNQQYLKYFSTTI